jgi:ABC-type Mn2+/Zn2+ transport system ATPase subunit
VVYHRGGDRVAGERLEWGRVRQRSQGAWGAWRGLLRGLLASAGAAALRRGLPVYAGLGAAAALLFGGNGLQATTVVAGAEGSGLARGLLWAGWLVIAGPTIEALWREPGSFWLRSLPAPRWWHLAILGGLTIAAEGPWVALWWGGGGMVAGIGALGGALAGHALLLARPSGWSGVIVVVAGAVGLWVAPIWGLAFGTWPIALVGFRRAWLAAPGRAASRRRAWIGGGRVVALAGALAVGLGRGHAAVLGRAGLLVGLATAAAWLAGRNTGAVDPVELRGLALGFFTPVAVLVGSAVAGPLLTIEARAGWLLRTHGATGRTRLAAMVLTVAGVGAGLGVLAAAVLVRVWGLGLGMGAGLVVGMLVSGAAVAGLAGLAGRWAATMGTRGPGRLVAMLFGLVVVAVAVQVRLPGWGAWVLLAAMVLTWSIGHVRATERSLGGATVVLEMLGIHKRLGGRRVLAGVDLRCDRGELALVLGENGAGKSTLLRVAAGVVEPERGEVRVGGATVSGGGVAGRGLLGYVPDTSDAFPELSVRELVALTAALRRCAPPDEGLRERLGLAAIWHQRLRTLSFGQVKRAYLLCALAGAPPLLVLDEPSNGLDPAGVEMLVALLGERAQGGGAALVATNDAAFATRLGAAPRRLVAGQLI